MGVRHPLLLPPSAVPGGCQEEGPCSRRLHLLLFLQEMGLSTNLLE